MLKNTSKIDFFSSEENTFHFIVFKFGRWGRHRAVHLVLGDINSLSLYVVDRDILIIIKTALFDDI